MLVIFSSFKQNRQNCVLKPDQTLCWNSEVQKMKVKIMTQYDMKEIESAVRKLFYSVENAHMCPNWEAIFWGNNFKDLIIIQKMLPDAENLKKTTRTLTGARFGLDKRLTKAGHLDQNLS